MKISVASDPFSGLEKLEYLFSVASEVGFDGIDLSLGYLNWDNIKVRDWSPFICDYDRSIEFAEKVNELCEKYNLEILQTHAPAPTWFEGYTDDVNQRLSNAISNAIHITKVLGCKYCVVHPYFYVFTSERNQTSPEKEHDLNIELYTSLLPALKETGVICCLENMWIPERRYRGRGNIYSAICENPYQVNSLVSELNEIAGEELYGFCLDTGHSLLSGYDPCKVVPLIADKIKIFHLHDNDGVDDLHTFPYTGITDWNRLCKSIKEMGYSGHLNFETGGCQGKFTPSSGKRDRAMDHASFRAIFDAGKIFVEKITGEPYSKEELV